MVKLIGQQRSDLYEVVEVREDRFSVRNLDKSLSSLFVYGRPVDDFHTVDYEAISMLNVSATQAQQQMIESLPAENDFLKSELREIKQLITEAGL